MTTKAEFEALAAPLRANLKRAIASLDALSGADFDDEEALGRLAKATYLAGLGARGLAVLSVADEDFPHVRAASALILTQE